MDTPPAAVPTPLVYWEPSYKLLSESLIQELASEALTARWEKIDFFASFLVAATATGSAVGAWALWSTQSGKVVWGIIAGTASVASIVHTTLKVPGRIKDQEELHRLFQQERLAINKFRSDLEIGVISMHDATAEYERLQKEYQQIMAKTKTCIAYTTGLRRQATALRDAKLKEENIAS
jgi:hypothetical protein